MELHERIKKIVEYSNLSIPQFSKKVGFKTPQTIRELIKGNTKTLSYQVKEKILNSYPCISEPWLLTGEGPMLIQANEADASAPGAVAVGGDNTGTVTTTQTSVDQSLLNIIATKDQQIDRLLTIIERMQQPDK